MKNLELLIDESIIYELDAHKLYTFFKDSFPADAEFWKKLADEELTHSAILRKSKSFFQKKEEVLNIISSEDIDCVKKCRNLIAQYREEFVKSPLPQTACKIAIKVEKSLVENNYQKFMTTIPESNLAKVFQVLNGEEKDHIKRINEYFKTKCV